jgi:hypothetical protein
MASLLGVMAIAWYPEYGDVRRQRRQVGRDSLKNYLSRVVPDPLESLSLAFVLSKGPRVCLQLRWPSSPRQLNEVPTPQTARWERTAEKNGFRGVRMQRDVSRDHGDPSVRSRESCLGVLRRVSRSNPRMPHARISDTSTTKRRVTLSKCLEAQSEASEPRQTISLLTTCRTDVDFARPADNFLMFQMLNLSLEYW